MPLLSTTDLGHLLPLQNSGFQLWPQPLSTLIYDLVSDGDNTVIAGTAPSSIQSGPQQTYIASSRTGQGWERKSVAPGYNRATRRALAHNGGPSPATIWVAVCNDGRIDSGGAGLYYSTDDGKNWFITSRGVEPTFRELTSVCWTGTKFVAMGALGLVLNSSNGITWTRDTSLYDALAQTNFTSVIHYPGTDLLIAVGNAGRIATKSATDEQWQQRQVLNGSTVITKNWIDVAWNGSTTDPWFFAIAFDGTGARSQDGINWTYVSRFINPGSQFNVLIWDLVQSQWIVGGSGGALLVNTSNDPSTGTWTQVIDIYQNNMMFALDIYGIGARGNNILVGGIDRAVVPDSGFVLTWFRP